MTTDDAIVIQPSTHACPPISRTELEETIGSLHDIADAPEFVLPQDLLVDNPASAGLIEFQSVYVTKLLERTDFSLAVPESVKDTRLTPFVPLASLVDPFKQLAECLSAMAELQLLLGREFSE